MFVKRPVNLVRSPILFLRMTSPWLLLPQCSGKAIQRLPRPCFSSAVRREAASCMLLWTEPTAPRFKSFCSEQWKRLSKQVIPCPSSARAAISSRAKSCGNFSRPIFTDNRAFGYFTDGSIEDYFGDGAREDAARRLDEIEPGADSAAFCLVFGPGAYWLGEGRFDLSFYLDVSREYQQAGHRQELLEFRP